MPIRSGQPAKLNSPPLGRYSFLMADPFRFIVAQVGQENALAELSAVLQEYQLETIPDLPPMQGGLAGLFSYDLNRSFERIPSARTSEFDLPAIAVGAYDVVLAWDHWEGNCWLISQGLPETDPDRRARRAEQRASYFKRLLNDTSPETAVQCVRQRWSDGVNRWPGEPEAAEYPVDGSRIGLVTNFSRSDYLAAVQRSIDYIQAGDIFQVNLAQQLRCESKTDPLTLYRCLCRVNPAPFSCYFDLHPLLPESTQIISCSPERLLTVRERMVETRPIKGTRRRTGRPMVDIGTKDRLLASAKDRAENTMIVDLMRNDLSKVCKDPSIHVTQLCELEEYKRVLHLVSAVVGEMQDDRGLTDLLAAVFPGGSITGAPKIRAMEIISELEPTSRGAYCGSIGYLGFDGNADLNILIRTITATRNRWHIPVGGGIVAQSDLQSEYEETWTKAQGMLEAIHLAAELASAPSL